MEGGLAAVLVVAVVAVFLFTRWVNRVDQYNRIVIFTFGRFEKVAGPGLVVVY